MKPNNLRSVVTQVTQGWRSVVSRRNLSTISRRRNSSSSRTSYESGGSYFELFGKSFVSGACVVAGWETIQLVEYGRAMQKYWDEQAGRESEAPLRDFMHNLVQLLLYGKIEPK